MLSDLPTYQFLAEHFIKEFAAGDGIYFALAAKTRQVREMAHVTPKHSSTGVQYTMGGFRGSNNFEG